MNDIVMPSIQQEFKIEKIKSSLTQIESEDIEKILNIIQLIKSSPNAINFQLPVDTRIYPDYLKAINDKPMDISTIETKMAGKKYHFIQDVFDDFQLIWDNCRIYNKEGFEIYYQAERMEETTVLAFQKFYVIQKGEKKNYVCEFDNNVYDEEAFNDPNYYKENYITVEPYFQNLKEKLEVSKIIKEFSSNQLKTLIDITPDQLKSYIKYETENEIRILIEQMTLNDLNELLKVLIYIQNTCIDITNTNAITNSNYNDFVSSNVDCNSKSNNNTNPEINNMINKY